MFRATVSARRGRNVKVRRVYRGYKIEVQAILAPHTSGGSWWIAAPAIISKVLNGTAHWAPAPHVHGWFRSKADAERASAEAAMHLIDLKEVGF